MKTLTAFRGDLLLHSGPAAEVALAVKATSGDDVSSILAFDDGTGRQVDFNLRGSEAEIAARLALPAEPAEEPKRPGRPKLGVVPREVTLLPRHWDWLSAQPGGASVTLRKLVDAARGASEAKTSIRQAQQAADRVMLAMLGNQPHYEDASRALYAGNREKFLALTELWPTDPRDYVRRLAAPAFPTNN